MPREIPVTSRRVYYSGYASIRSLLVLLMDFEAIKLDKGESWSIADDLRDRLFKGSFTRTQNRGLM